MQLFVCIIAVVREINFPLFSDRLIQGFQHKEQLAIFRLVIRQSTNMSGTIAKRIVRQGLDLLDQVPSLPVRNTLGEQDAVDQQPQLSLCKQMLVIEIRTGDVLIRFSGFFVWHISRLFRTGPNRIYRLHQIRPVTLNGFSIHGHAIFTLQEISDLFPGQGLLLVCMFSQNLQNVENQYLLRLHPGHADHLEVILHHRQRFLNIVMQRNRPHRFSLFVR